MVHCFYLQIPSNWSIQLCRAWWGELDEVEEEEEEAEAEAVAELLRCVGNRCSTPPLAPAPAATATAVTRSLAPSHRALVVAPRCLFSFQPASAPLSSPCEGVAKYATWKLSQRVNGQPIDITTLLPTRRSPSLLLQALLVCTKRMDFIELHMKLSICSLRTDRTTPSHEAAVRGGSSPHHDLGHPMQLQISQVQDPREAAAMAHCPYQSSVPFAFFRSRHLSVM